MQKRALRAMRAPQIPQSRSRFRSSIVICAPQWGQTLAAPGKGAPHEEQCSVTASRLGFMSMADRSYTLTIMRRSGLLTLLVLLAIPGGCVFAQSAVAPAEAKPVAAPARPSVLIVTLDTTRADALGCYGAPEWATPNLDALARRGVRFATARAPAPITAPAHATIFTGLYPFQHGVRDNGTFVLRDDVQTLAERLKAADYATAAVPAAIVVDSTFGLNQGFDHYFDPADQTRKLSLAPNAEVGEHVGVDRSTRFEVYVSTARAYVLLDAAPYGCFDLPATGAPAGTVSVTFGDVLFHSDIDHLEFFGYMREQLQHDAQRHFDNLGFKSGVAAPAWDEARMPCTSAFFTRPP